MIPRRSLATVFASATFALALLAPLHADAQRCDYSPLEQRGLPEYCRYTQNFRSCGPRATDKAEVDRWTRLMGPTFNHMHHYCMGLIDINHATYIAKSREERVSYLGHSVVEFDYVIERAPPDFSLLPEILTRKGESLIGMGRGPQGVAALRGAIDVDPSYWLPYATISDYYKETGDLAKAREWLQKGLSVAPNARGLTRRVAELDSTQAGRRKNATPPAER
jgi:tetratricopeptide (TPR) repeat protein